MKRALLLVSYIFAVLLSATSYADDIWSRRHMTNPRNDGTWPYLIVCDGGGTNLAGPTGLGNPSYEGGITDWNAQGTGASISHETTEAWVGDDSLQVDTTGNDNTGTRSDAITGISGTTVYSLAARMKGDSGGETVSLELDGNSSTATIINVTLDDEWREYRLAKTSAAGDTEFTISMFNNGAKTQTWYVDGVDLQEGISNPTAYKDDHRTPGCHWDFAQATNIANPLIVHQDGTIIGINTTINIPYQPAPVAGNYGLNITGRANTLQNIGADSGLIRIYNSGNGAALIVKSDNTTDFGMIIDGGSTTTGTILGIAAPSDLSSFTGKFFTFLDKSGKNMYQWLRDRQDFGVASLWYPSELRMHGGGRLDGNNTTTLTGTISTTGSSTTINGAGGTSFDTDFAVGDTIIHNTSGQVRIIQSITDADTLVVTAAANWGSSAYSQYDAQYEPALITMESYDGNHVSATSTGRYHTMWFDESDNLRTKHSTTAAGAKPTSESDGAVVGGGGGGGATWVTAFKTGDTSRSNNTLLDDPHLDIALSANTDYIIHFFGSWDHHGSPDYKYAFNVPTGTTFSIGCFAGQGGGATSRNYARKTTDASSTSITGSTNSGYVQHCTGVVEVAGTAGNLAYMWAQNSTDGANPITLYQGSYIKAMEQ